MAQLTFSDPQKGTIHIQGLTPRQPFEGDTSIVRHQVQGIPLTDWQGPYAPDKGPWLLTWQAFRLVFHAQPHAAYKPPFWFGIRGREMVKLETDHISPSLYTATVPAQIASGYVELVLVDARGVHMWQWETEIFPHLFGYRRHDQMMVRQLQAVLYGLAFNPLGTPYLRLQLGLETTSYLPDDLKSRINALDRLLPLLAQHLQIRPQSQTTFIPIHRLGGRENRLQPAQFWKSTKQAREHGPRWSGYSARQVPIRHHTLGLNHPLNQWLAQRLQTIQRLLLSSSDAIAQAGGANIQRLLGKWDHAGIKVPVRQLMRPSYLPGVYQVFASWERALYRRLVIWEQGWFRLPPKSTATLYEYWCFVQMVQLIEDLTQATISFQDVIETHGTAPSVRLRHGQSVRCEWQMPRGAGKVVLWYQPRLTTQRGDQVQQPDMLLELFKPGQLQPFGFVFDAKYRLKHPDKPSGPPTDALDQLHRYRDRIQWGRHSLTDRELGRKILGGALLFPFPGDPQEFVQHPDYQALFSAQIGAIPLTPGQYGGHSLLKDYLSALLALPAEGLYEQIVDYDRREQQSQIKEFDIWLELRDVAADPLPISQGVVLKQEGLIHSYRLAGQDDWHKVLLDVDPQELGKTLSLGHLKQAIAYQQGDILSLRDYHSFRLWQEIYQQDKDLRVWQDNGALYYSFMVNGHQFRCIYGSPIRLVFPDGRLITFEQARMLKSALPF